MSEERLEIIRAFYNAWNRRAWDETLANAAPDIEFDLTRNAGEWRGVHVGSDQVTRMFERFVEPWESIEMEVRDCVDGGEQVVTRHSAHFVGRDGIALDVEGPWVWTFRDGDVITKIVAYDDFEQALAAAGLPSDS